MQPVAVAKYSIAQLDIEQRLGIRGGRHTRVSTPLALALTIVLSVGFYASLWFVRGTTFAELFTERGPMPYLVVLFAFWSLVILTIKMLKVRAQRLVLREPLVPSDPDFVLCPATADQVLERLHRVADEPRAFVVFNRIQYVLVNLKNIGRISDVDDMLCSQGANDEDGMRSSYLLVRSFIWALPVLGFIGTVQGLSQAIGSFGDVLRSGGEIQGLKSGLQNVTGGLSTAFDTTLIALIAALGIHLILTVVQKTEEEFLEACNEYCHRNIVSRLRILPLEQEPEHAQA